MRGVSVGVIGLALGVPLFAQNSEAPARLSLDDALRIAEARNPRMAASHESVLASEAGVLGAKKRPNPALSLSSEGIPLSEKNRPAFFDNQELLVSIEQAFEPGGRRGLRTTEAERAADVARAVSRDARRQLRFEVSSAYMAVVLAKADEEVARDTLRGIDTVIALNRARFEQGELSGVELRRLQVERFRFADDEFAAELALRNARSSLLALLNARPLDQAFETTEDLLPPSLSAAVAAAPSSTAQSAIDRAMGARPDLDAARRDLQRAAAGVRLQRALRLPSFTLGAGLRRDFGENGLFFSFGVPLPLFDRNEAGLARAGADERQAAARLTEAEILVSLDVQQALDALDVARRRVSYVEGEYLKSAREARDIVLASYRGGAATLIDYLDAERALREALRIQNRARFDYRISLFQYEAATGTPAPAGRKELP